MFYFILQCSEDIKFQSFSDVSFVNYWKTSREKNDNKNREKGVREKEKPKRRKKTRTEKLHDDPAKN